MLFVVSGTLLWLGERNTAFRLPGTIALHDVAMFVAVVLIAGHVAMALSQRPALEGMMYGTVPEDWAAEHHAAWTPAPPAPPAAPGIARIALAVVVAAGGLVAAVLLAADALG